MTVKTFLPEECQGCPVYYRQIKDHFEYFTVINGQLYTAHSTLRPRLLRWLAYKLGFVKEAYTEKEYEGILKFLRAMAETTITTTKNASRL